MAVANARIIGGAAIEQALINAFEIWTREDVDKKHWDEQFGNMNRWEWPSGNETKRKNTEVVRSPRDIYDLGLLYEQRNYKYEKGRDSATAHWYWNATNSKGTEYASYVHNGTKTMDGRAFTDDISIPSSFFLKQPGKDLLARVSIALEELNAA